MKDAQAVAWAFNAGIQFVLILVIFAKQLYRSFRLFAAWLLVSLSLQLALWLAGGPKKTAYAYVYLISEPVTVLFLFGTVYEVYSLRAGRYRAVGKVGRWLLAASLAGAATAAMIAYLAGPPGVFQAIIFGIVILRRTAFSILAAFTIASSILFDRYWVASRPNLQTHHHILAVYLTFHAVAMVILFSRNQTILPLVNAASLGLTGFCFLAWAIRLRAEVEIEPPVAVSPSADRIESAAQAWIERLGRA